jgi:hypothetical protein
MPSETTHFKIKYAVATDELEKFPTQVSEPGAKTIDELLYEKLLRFTTSTAETGTLAVGEYARVASSATAPSRTLPSATAGYMVGIYNAGGSTSLLKVKTPSGAFYGGFIDGASELVLTSQQNVLLLGEGSNWYIIAGEPKREQTYSSFTSYTSGTSVEPSATRPAFVLLSTQIPTGRTLIITPHVGGVALPAYEVTLVAESEAYIPYPMFYVPPGLKWSASITGTGYTAKYQTIFL